MAKTILKILDKPESLLSFVEDRLRHDRKYSICSDRIKNELRWKPAYSFEEGMATTIEFYKGKK